MGNWRTVRAFKVVKEVGESQFSHLLRVNRHRFKFSLERVRLKQDDGFVLIQDEVRWSEVLICERVRRRMPSTM
jgi:hypothetical protein